MFFVYLLQKSLKLGNVSPQAIVTKLFDAPSLYRSTVLPIIFYPSFTLAVRELKMAASAELVDLDETEAASRKPTKAVTKALEFPPQVTQFFNIMGFKRFLGVLMEFLEVKLEIFRTFLEKIRKYF